ncbi:MAG: DUF4340 domain-containing protein [Planctomycetota bacterium]
MTTPPAAKPAPELLLDDDEASPWLTNLVLLIVVLALGAWVWQGEGEIVVLEDRPQDGQLVFASYQFHPFQAVGITLERGAEKVELSRKVSEAEARGDYSEQRTAAGHTAPTGWQMSSPVADRGDDTMIHRLLNRVERAKFTLKVEGEEAQRYPFGEPTARLSIARKEDRAPLAFELGTPRGGSVPLRLVPPGPVPRVYLVPEELHTELTLAAWNWRDKTLFQLKLEEVRAAELAVAAQGPGAQGPGAAQVRLRVTRGTRGWRVGDATGDVADKDEAEGLVEAVRLLQAVSVEKDGAAAQDLAALGLAPPQATVSLWRADGEPRVLELGAFVPGRVKERYARLRDRPGTVYAVQAAVLEERAQKPEAGYLGRELFPVEGKLDAVSRLGAEPRGGPRWQVFKQKEVGWRFEGPSEALQYLCDQPAVEERIKGLLKLEIRERLPADGDRAALGLSPPALSIELFEGDYRHVVHVGAQREPGIYVVERPLPRPEQGQPPVVYRYTAELGALPADLAEAPLELLSRRVFAASSFEARELSFQDREGKLVKRAHWLPTQPQNPQGMHEWRIEGEPAADGEAFKAFMKSFDEVNAQRWVARREGADLARYGLDRPAKLTIKVVSFAGGARQLVDMVLLLGDRVGETSVYAMTPTGPAVALIDALFLDRVYLGFSKRQELGAVDVWSVRRVRVERDGVPAWEAEKSGVNWRWGGEWRLEGEEGLMPQDAYGPLEKLLESERELGKLQVASPEPATPQRLKETGLDRPRWRITIGEGEGKVTLLVGDRIKEREVWAMVEGKSDLGVFFDEPLLRLAELIQRQPGPPPFPTPRD